MDYCPKPFYMYINCPVDVEVYDTNSVLQLRITNDEIIKRDASPVDAMIDDSGQKIVNIPADVEASIKIIATDDGSFTYSAQEYNSDIDEVTFLTNYYEVPISKDDELISHIDEMTSNGNRNIVLYDEEGEVITPSEVLSQDLIF